MKSVIAATNNLTDRVHGRDRIIWWVCAVLALACLSIHYLILLVYVFPNTPLRTHYEGRLNQYVNPLFTQSWSFFAPVPSNKNIHLIAREEYIDGTGLARVSPWWDISDALITAQRHARFSGYPVLAAFTMNTVDSYFEKTEDEVKKRYGSKNKDQLNTLLSAEDSDPMPASLDARDGEILRRIAAALFTRNNYNKRPTKIQVGIQIESFARF